MTEQHTSTKRIVDEQGRLLYEERSKVSLKGDSAHEDVERTVQSCPSCGSRLDQVGLKGQCWSCRKHVCENCHVIARCCVRVLCNDHKNSAIWQDQPLPVCEEHAPILWQLEAMRIGQIRQEQETKQELARSQEQRQWTQVKLQAGKLRQELKLRHNEQVLKAHQMQANLVLQQARLQWEMSRAVIEMGQRAVNQLGSVPSLPSLRQLPKGGKADE